MAFQKFYKEQDILNSSFQKRNLVSSESKKALLYDGIIDSLNKDIIDLRKQNNLLSNNLLDMQQKYNLLQSQYNNISNDFQDLRTTFNDFKIIVQKIDDLTAQLSKDEKLKNSKSYQTLPNKKK